MNRQDDRNGHRTGMEAIIELLEDKSARSLLGACLTLQLCQQLCGINAVFYYSTSFFHGTGYDHLV